MEDLKPIEIITKDPNSRWAAFDDDNNVIAEGLTPKEVIEKAKEKGTNFILVFIPSTTCIFYYCFTSDVLSE